MSETGGLSAYGSLGNNPSGASRHLPLHRGGFGVLYMTEIRAFTDWVDRVVRPYALRIFVAPVAFIERRGEGTPPYEMVE